MKIYRELKHILNRLVIIVMVFGILYAASLKATPTNGLIIAQAHPRTQATGPTKIYLPVVRGSPTMGNWTNGTWPMVAANPQRTSWTPEEVSGNLNVLWYRPIEAYISQNVQIIANYGFIYISTSKGLYALNANTGDIAWRYDTELPLGNSPTVVDHVAYVGGYDHKLHALDAATGHHLWEFNGASAGYDTNPLVVDGKVILGNRDGYMYAIGAQSSPQQGQLVWKFKTGGPILLSAAYQDGVVYFASNDNYAYALNATNGSLIWKSSKLPGMQYQSYWPVILQDKVVFSAAYGYRSGSDPGSMSVPVPGGGTYDNYLGIQLDDIFPTSQEGTLVGPQIASESWGHGYPIIDVNTLTEYLENNPNPDPDKHKPWRRLLVALERGDGREFTFDSDHDGYPEYLPAAYWGTGSGNRYPGIVGSDGIFYFSNLYSCCSDAKGRIMGWNSDSPSHLSVTEGFGAVAEPQAISAGGNLIYRNICCDRVGDYFSILRQRSNRQIWSYNLSDLAPNYDPLWTIYPGWPRLHGFYKGASNSINAAYHNHGDQNPIIPYQGKLFVHRSNTIIAFGAGQGPGALPTLPIVNHQDNFPTPGTQQVSQLLESEVQKIVDAGHLRPGYYNVAQFLYPGLADYYGNPGDTLYTLTRAYPYLSESLKTQVRTYLQNEFQAYFDPNMYATIGWSSGAARESMTLPPEVVADLANHPPRPSVGGFSWPYPQYNFYGMWKYATIFPSQAVQVYNLAKSKLQVPVPAMATTDYFQQQPYELNGYIAGYIGFLNLQQLAGMQNQDSQLRTSVTNELNRLEQMRVNIFTKDSYWTEDHFYKKNLDIARNFIFLVPELGTYLQQHIPSQVDQAISEYEYVAPYWFVSRYEGTIGEGVMSNLYNYYGLFQAKAYIQGETWSELSKYLDVPAFERGDLYYLQNLIALLDSQSSTANVPANSAETNLACMQ